MAKKKKLTKLEKGFGGIKMRIKSGMVIAVFIMIISFNFIYSKTFIPLTGINIPLFVLCVLSFFGGIIWLILEVNYERNINNLIKSGVLEELK